MAVSADGRQEDAPRGCKEVAAESETDTGL